MKRTEWYAANIRPVRIGVYEVKRKYACNEEEMPLHRLKWTGFGWRYAERFRFASAGDFAAMTEGDFWRGLIKERA